MAAKRGRPVEYTAGIGSDALFPSPARRGRPPRLVSRRVSAAVAAADHLEPMDDAAVALAQRLALELDNMPDNAPGTNVKAISSALLSTLGALGLTPAGRRGVVTPREEDVDDDPIDNLRRLRDADRPA